MYDFAALSRWWAPSPAFLAFVHWYTCWDELEDNPFKCREQYPSGNKKFLPRSGQGRGWCCPPVAVEAETNMENSILWRQREEEDVGGVLIYFGGSAEGLNSRYQLGSTRVVFMAQKSVAIL